MGFMVCPLGTDITSYVTLYSEVFPFIIMCIPFILEPYLQHPVLHFKSIIITLLLFNYPLTSVTYDYT